MYNMKVYAMSHKTCIICITKISSIAASHVQSSSASVKRQWRRVGPASKRLDEAPKDKTSQKIEVSFPLFIKPHTHVHFFPPPSTTAENRDLKGPISEISTEPQLSAFRRSSIPPDLTCRAQQNLKTSSH